MPKIIVIGHLLLNVGTCFWGHSVELFLAVYIVERKLLLTVSGGLILRKQFSASLQFRDLVANPQDSYSRPCPGLPVLSLSVYIIVCGKLRRTMRLLRKTATCHYGSSIKQFNKINVSARQFMVLVAVSNLHGGPQSLAFIAITLVIGANFYAKICVIIIR